MTDTAATAELGWRATLCNGKKEGRSKLYSLLLCIPFIPYCLSTNDLRIDESRREDRHSCCDINGWSVSWLGYGWQRRWCRTIPAIGERTSVFTNPWIRPFDARRRSKSVRPRAKYDRMAFSAWTSLRMSNGLSDRSVASALTISSYSASPICGGSLRTTSRTITNHALIYRWNITLRCHVESSIHRKERWSRFRKSAVCIIAIAERLECLNRFPCVGDPRLMYALSSQIRRPAHQNA